MSNTGLEAAQAVKVVRDSERAERLLRLREVLSRVGVSRSTLYAWIAAGTFVAPVRLTEKLSAWPESAVADWIEQRIAAGTAKPGAK